MFKKYSSIEKDVQKIAVSSSVLPITVADTEEKEDLISVCYKQFFFFF